MEKLQFRKSDDLIGGMQSLKGMKTDNTFTKISILVPMIMKQFEWRHIVDMKEL